MSRPESPNTALAILSNDAQPLSAAAEREILAAFRKPRFAEMAAGSKHTGPCEPRPGKRKRLWDIEAMFHCPLIGTCAGVDELRRCARRGDLADVDSYADYELHSVAVNHAALRTPFADAMQKSFERKYQAEIAQTDRLDSAEKLACYWRGQLAGGDVAGAMWALVTHPHTSAALIEVVYRDVHMLSHQVGAGQRASLRRQRELAEECERLRSKLAEQQQAHERRLQEQREVLSRAEAERERARVASSGNATHAAASALGAMETRLAALEAQLGQLRGHAEELERRLAAALARNRMLEDEARRNRAEVDATEHALRALSGAMPDEATALPDLAGRELLCVGGRINLREHYRSLVERCNGRFNYHDGGIEDGEQRLHGLLARADAVICPSDCIGHPAYHEVKKLCKRTGKPCVLLSNSGLGSFSRGLKELNGALDSVATDDSAATLISL